MKQNIYNGQKNYGEKTKKKKKDFSIIIFDVTRCGGSRWWSLKFRHTQTAVLMYFVK